MYNKINTAVRLRPTEARMTTAVMGMLLQDQFRRSIIHFHLRISDHLKTGELAQYIFLHKNNF